MLNYLVDCVLPLINVQYFGMVFEKYSILDLLLD